MGKVVKLAEAAASRVRGQGAPRRRRRRRSKTALVLGGGGFTGGVYEIGALRALDLLSVNRTVNEFDVYVGTSAGSFVASMAANGVTPEEMMRVVNQQVPDAVPRHRPRHPAAPEHPRVRAQGACTLPLQAREARRATLAGQLGSVSAMDVVLGLAEALPSRPVLRRGHRGLRAHGAVGPRPHRRLPRLLEHELYLAATDLDTCERIVFGAERLGRRADLARRSRASTALPMVYKPVARQRPRARRRRHRLDDEPRHRRRGGREVRRRRQPARALRQRLHQDGAARCSARAPQHVSDMGFPQIGYQAFKLLAYQRLHEMARQWEQRYPGVDIVLIEPDARRRADVPDVDHELHQRASTSPATASSR